MDPNITEAQIEKCLLFNLRRLAGLLASPEVQSLKTNPIVAKAMAFLADTSTVPAAQPLVAPITLKGPLWENNVFIYVKFEMDVLSQRNT